MHSPFFPGHEQYFDVQNETFESQECAGGRVPDMNIWTATLVCKESGKRWQRYRRFQERFMDAPQITLTPQD